MKRIIILKPPFLTVHAQLCKQIQHRYVYISDILDSIRKAPDLSSTLDNNLTISCSCGVANVILCPVKLLQLQELLHPFCGDPGLHESIDDPGEGIQGTDEDVEQSHTGEHLQRVVQGWRGIR